MKKAAALFLFLAIFFTSQGLDAREIPKLTGRVVDEADILLPGEEQALTQKLADYENQTTNQIVVVTIPSLEGEVLEDFSIRLAEAWKIGQKGKDNGVILLIARDDRKSRIEVGYGLEPVLTDGRCGGIIRNFMTPLFRQEKFFDGISATVDAMMKYIAGETVKFHESLEKTTGPVGDLLLFFAWVILLCSVWFLFSVLFPGTSGSSWNSGGGGGGSSGSGGGGGGGFSGGGGSFGGGGASGGW